MTNTETIEYFFKENSERFTRETKRIYRLTLKQFCEYCKKNFDEVTRSDVRMWCVELDQMGKKPATVNFKLATLKSIFRVLYEDELILSDPTKGKKFDKPVEGLPRYLSHAQLAQLFELTKDDVLMRTVTETLYATGVRISELMNIKLEDINWDLLKINIRKGKGDMERIVPFTTQCKERLIYYLGQRIIQSPYLFASTAERPFCTACIRNKFENYAKYLDTDFKVTPHCIRHTFAAHLAEKGMPLRYIKALLGHMNYKSTLIYTKLCTEARKKRLEY